MWKRNRHASTPALDPTHAERRAEQARTHERVRAFLDDLDLPPASNIRDLVPVIEEFTGRSIQLVPADLGDLPGMSETEHLCGLWYATATTSNIFYDRTASRAHADGIIAHEFGHILRRHHKVDDGLLSGVGTLGGILPDMTPDLIKMLVGRTRYADPDEAEAETVGSLLLAHVNSGRTAPDHDDPISRTLLRGPTR
ncbi:hypothetical protein ABT160_37380 [Streptomyces sp. NPDC001941]|uniref:hypothetical protein n=1 Tax=Streptomyces sp. NPDC001941 TaxID=3154659 RepID=UPI00332656AB